MKFEPKNKTRKLELLEKDKGYAFTINPEEQYYGDINRFQKVINLLKRLLKPPSFDYKIYIELSPTGRIHGHGWLWIKDPIEFVMHDIYEITKRATIYIDTIDDHDVWQEYCTKQSHIIGQLLKPAFIACQKRNQIDIKDIYDMGPLPAPDITPYLQ